MHAALSIPEIVASILPTYSSSSSFLYPCLLINKLFFHEASRLLWEVCGAGSIKPTAGVPRIRHLAALVSNNIERAQYYANFIRRLYFQKDLTLSTEWEDSLEQYELQFHHLLRKLSFPVLETLRIVAHPDDECLKESEDILCYSHSGLMELYFIDSGELTDSFLDTLSARAPRLRKLWLSPSSTLNTRNISETAMVRFLKNMPHLIEIYMPDRFEGGWSPRVLESVISHENLITISIPDIPDNWMAESYIKSALRGPQLRELNTGVSPTTLGLLLPWLQNLTCLALDISRFPPRLSPSLRLISRLKQLTFLAIFLPSGSRITDTDLIVLVKNCQLLRTLHLPWNGPSATPIGEDITDDTIEEIVKYLPNLKEVTLLLRPINLTYKSFLSFCENCKCLNSCVLTIDIDFQTFILEANDRKSTPYPSITNLGFTVLTENRPEYTNLEKSAREFVDVIPNIWTILIHSGLSQDLSFESAVRNVIYSRK